MQSLELTGTIVDENGDTASDHYEILRLGPDADDYTVDRVYRILWERFRPDNPVTGDARALLRLQDAYETLSDPLKRARYNSWRQRTRDAARFRLVGRDFFDGVRGEQNRRLAALCLLYRQRISNCEAPGLTLLDLETLTGCTREELASALWYLSEKRWAVCGDKTAYSITAEGFDVVEKAIEQRAEFLALATVRYYE
jgi:curved DNA-binding protein CbpA